jgi:hypothetical protein
MKPTVGKRILVGFAVALVMRCVLVGKFTARRETFGVY